MVLTTKGWSEVERMRRFLEEEIDDCIQLGRADDAKLDEGFDNLIRAAMYYGAANATSISGEIVHRSLAILYEENREHLLLTALKGDKEE